MHKTGGCLPIGFKRYLEIRFTVISLVLQKDKNYLKRNN